MSSAIGVVRGALSAVLISGLFSPALAAPTNSHWFTRVWQSDEGLPNNTINGVTQGADGYLWVGTTAGLARFDGVRFTKFSIDLKRGESQGVRFLLGRRGGGFWIVQNRGPIVCVNSDLSSATIITNGLPQAPSLVLEDHAGGLWITYRNGLCRIQNGQTTQMTAREGVPPAGWIYSIINDYSGNVWLSKAGRADIFRNGQFQNRARFNGKPRLAPARTNGVWIAVGAQLYKCSDHGDLQNIGAFTSDARITALAVLEDHTGAVWIGTDIKGLFRYDESGFEHVETSHPFITSLEEDRQGNVWAGTGGGGLNRISTRGVHLEGLEAGSSLTAIRSVCQDTRGVLWGATPDGLVVVRTNDQWCPALTNGPWNGIATCVAADRTGGMWIGTHERKLFHWQDNDYTAWEQQNGLAGHDVVALLPATTGELWVGAAGLPGVQCLRAGQLSSLQFSGTIGRFAAMAEDAAGNIWIGTHMGQLLRVEGDHLVDETLRTSGPDYPAIRCLYPTADGALWIGYGGWGLGRLKNGRFARVGVEEGLSDEYISEIVGDDRGWLWFGSDHGVFKVLRQDLEQALEGGGARVVSISYGQNEGLSSMEADFGFQTVALRSRDGRVWLPMRAGLVVADPTVLHENPGSPPALLTRATVDGRTIASYGTVGSTQIVANLKTSGPPLRLAPGHRKLEFEFAAPSFSAPENVRMRYRLENFDDDWVDAGTLRTAVYSRLMAGAYRFRIQAANENGPWKEAATALGIVVTPFFWQTWWFRFGMLAFFTLCVIAVVRYVSFRRLRLKLRLLEQQATLDKERTRIARDLHDDLGGSLTQVKQLFELALRNHGSPEKMSDYLQRGLTTTQQGIKSLDETVWAVNPHNDTLPYVIDYIGQSALEFLRMADIRCRADFPASLPDQTISAEARHSLFLVVKEALNNVVRHARASEVQLRVAVTEASLTFTIEDNGTGFERQPDDVSGDGLRNMRQRIEEIGGQFNLDSRPGAGTRISFVYPWAKRR